MRRQEELTLIVLLETQHLESTTAWNCSHTINTSKRLFGKRVQRNTYT